ncbi:Aminopeptidase N [Budvicia aquatica]|uniref:Aminopeptidase N n=1 Tax=Budvicia aquatica TaxID=82979 RepID=A0A484ZWH4_9GAMM|nr:Aminopeptidase N [Budvicia aquatica]
MTEKPIISLLREFSAPVKLDYPYTDQQLSFLMQYATNDFARWDAAQMLLAKHIKDNVSRLQQGEMFDLPLHVVDAFRAVLLSDQLDPALAAQILTLPSENEIAELFDIIDPDAIHQVRSSLITCLATELQDEWLAIYVANKTERYQIDHGDIAKRALRNVCLSYLAFTDRDFADNLISQQYHHANNMTDSLAALSAAVAAELPCRDKLMSEFDERWHQDGLVMDKWFILQASSPNKQVLQTIKSLLNHRSFSINNPNRIRSLIGAFASTNPSVFHAKDGSGYDFLTEILIDLNQRNPQVASRLIEPMIRLSRYDESRQALMRSSLEKLKALDNLSGDLFEKITKTLNGG